MEAVEEKHDKGWPARQQLPSCEHCAFLCYISLPCVHNQVLYSLLAALNTVALPSGPKQLSMPVGIELHATWVPTHLPCPVTGTRLAGGTGQQGPGEAGGLPYHALACWHWQPAAQGCL